MSEPGGDASARAQAAQALIALAAEAALAWKDPQFLRRQRHGDPTALPELRARACARVGADAVAIEALLRQDQRLSQLWDQTVEQARMSVADGDGRTRTIVLLAIAAVVVCVLAWGLFTHYQAQAAAHRVQPRQDWHPP